jgi:ectoine hydroxylase-related dioxygenase (phytanoyl-CoA dioxygenase family)
LVVSDTFFCVCPAFHLDNTLWSFHHPESISIWVALDDVTVQNGCMNFMPRSHREAVAHIGDDADYAMTPSGQAVRGGEGDFFHKCDSRHEIAHLTAGLGSDFVHHL